MATPPPAHPTTPSAGGEKDASVDEVTQTPPPSSASSSPSISPPHPPAPKASWRTHLPLTFKAPLDTLFPPSPPPGTSPFVAAAGTRAKWNARKLLFRASLVTLSCFILILEPVTLAVLGNAAFFGMIVSIMLPPTMPVFVFIMVMTTLVTGMATGWAWGSAAMAAGLRARSTVLLASQLQRVDASLAGATNPDTLYQVSIFKGEFLDARCTVVFGVFLFVGTFAFGLMRANAPKLTLLAIFGTIVLDVMLSYGPLFPFAEYTLATNFLLPTSMFLAIAMAANALIFPKTLNSSWTTDCVDSFLIPIYQRSGLHSKLLATPPPTDEVTTAAWGAIDAQLVGLGAKASGGLDALLGSIMFVEMEVSFGRLSAKDLHGVLEPMRELFARSMGLGVFGQSVNSTHKRISAREVALSETPPPRSKPAVSEHRSDRLLRKVRETESSHSHDLGSLLPVLASTSAPLRAAGDDALLGTMTWLTSVNSTRWFCVPSPTAIEEAYVAQSARIALVESTLAAFRTTGRAKLCAPFADFFDPVTGEALKVPGHAAGDGLGFSPASLFACFAASANLIWYAEALVAFVKHLHELEGKRRVNKLWWPTGLRKLGNLAIGGKAGRITEVAGEPVNGDPEKIEKVGADEEVDGKDKEEEAELADALGDVRLDPDAKTAKNARQRFSLKLYAFGKWTQTPETVFALKYSVLSVLLWLPQIFPKSAYICYTEKGLWMLIMGQTGLAVYSGDQISQTVQKFFGTMVGLVYGMLIWYIGAGHGSGNRIGLGAAVFILMIPPLAIRLYGPPQYTPSNIMGAVTSVLVVGYSWDDAHIVTVGNAGVGVNIAWRRALLVVMGMTAATIAMMFPRPVSARQLVRRTHATCIQEVGHIYATIVGTWLREQQLEASVATGDKESVSKGVSGFSQSMRKKARARMLALFIKLKGIRTSILQAGFEVSMRGDWPAAEYSELLDKQLAIVEALSQLGLALIHLDPEWRRVLVVKTAFLNPNLIADVTTSFYLISMALRQASPLPETTPGPLLDRLIYHEEKRRAHLTRAPTSPPPESDSEGSDQDLNHPKVNGAAIGTRLTFDILKDERFGIYATAILALSSILANVDELETVAKTLVGEVRFPGYEGLLARRGAD